MEARNLKCQNRSWTKVKWMGIKNIKAKELR